MDLESRDSPSEIVPQHLARWLCWLPSGNAISSSYTLESECHKQSSIGSISGVGVSGRLFHSFSKSAGLLNRHG